MTNNFYFYWKCVK